MIILILLFIILKIYNYSKKNFETETINTTQCISYIAEEITEMGELKRANVFEIKPQSMLESEFRMSTTVSSRNITSVDEEDENGNIVMRTTNDPNKATRYQIGKSAIPTFYGGLSTTVEAYGVDLSIATAFQGGGYLMDTG